MQLILYWTDRKPSSWYFVSKISAKVIKNANSHCFMHMPIKSPIIYISSHFQSRMQTLSSVVPPSGSCRPWQLPLLPLRQSEAAERTLYRYNNLWHRLFNFYKYLITKLTSSGWNHTHHEDALASPLARREMLSRSCERSRTALSLCVDQSSLKNQSRLSSERNAGELAW